MQYILVMTSTTILILLMPFDIVELTSIQVAAACSFVLLPLSILVLGMLVLILGRCDKSIKGHMTDISGSSEDPVLAKQCLCVLGWLQLTYRIEATVEGHTAGWTGGGAGQLVLTEQRYLEGSLGGWNRWRSFNWLPQPIGKYKICF